MSRRKIQRNQEGLTKTLKKIEELRMWRFAAWGAFATAGTLGLFFESPLAAGVGAVLGAGAGIAALSAARHAIGIAEQETSSDAIGG